MKTMLIFLMSLLIAGMAYSAIHYVDINGTAPYTEVQPAINAASAGDTIVVGPGLGYQAFFVDRRLYIIGAGTETDIGGGTCINGIVTIMDTADSTELWSLWIRGAAESASDSASAVLEIRSGTTGVLVARCFLQNHATGGFARESLSWIGNGSRVKFLQTVFWLSDETFAGSLYGVCVRTSSEVELVNCLFSRIYTGIGEHGTGAAAGIVAKNCIFTAIPNSDLRICDADAIGSFENCAFLNGYNFIQTSTGPNIAYNYCGFSINVPSGTGNITCSGADFENIDWHNARTSDYHLAAGSVLRDAGNPAQFDLDSTRVDIGIYGGMHPFVENGAPCYPFLLDVDIPTIVPQSGAVRIYVRGRIGTGY